MIPSLRLSNVPGGCPNSRRHNHKQVTAFLQRLTTEPVYDLAMAYRVELSKSDEGFSVSCPELPGCWSQGATQEEALANMQIAIREYIDAAEELSG